MPRYAFVLAASVLLAAGCAGHRVHDAGSTTWSSTDPAAATADTLTFADQLAAHGARPAAERFDARLAAEEIAASWRDFEREAREEFDSHFRHWYYRDNPVTRDHRGVGLPNAIADLQEATAIDPSFAMAWGALGRLTLEAGDWPTARRYLDNARLAARAEDAAGGPVDPEVLLRICRDRAWVLRDLALWDEGLAAVAEGLELHHGDPELVLIKGLLLADSGRAPEAVALAARMPALEYPRYDFIFRGFKQQTSAYANNWIRAQALLAEGKIDDAYWILGDLDLYAYRGLLPFAPRYWRDAALIAELHGDPKAPLYYAVGFVTRPYQRFYPVTAHNVSPQVLDLPAADMPVFLGFGMRFYVAGSPLVYVGTQINRMAMSFSEAERLQAGGRALQMLDILERRQVRADVCRALRGRIYFAGDDFGPARIELAAARDSFVGGGRVDPRTSLLLGLIATREDRWDAAEALLGEAAAADSANAMAWRSFGVALSMNGRLDRAESAMTRALELDPHAVSGWYNRGLLHLQRQQFATALDDLEHARSLDPENREVHRLLQMAATGLRDAGGDPGAHALGPPEGYAADPDTLAARLQAELTATLSVPDSLRLGTPGAEESFRSLETTHLFDPQLETRRLLALAYLERNLLDALQALLAPGWGVDLTPEEELILLWADRNLGELARAEEAVRSLLATGPGAGNPYALALAADMMRTSVDPVGTDAAAPNTHGYFGWWRDARMNYGADPHWGGTRIVGYAVDLFRQYREDPLFEQAVWGLPGTPATGANFGVGGSAGDKGVAR